MCKYIFVVGGVFSGTGKGVAACSVGLLLKLRGFSVQYIKLEPYGNLNSGILRPGEHGESFVCDDGTETDLDLGHAERIIGINMSRKNIVTSGMLHKQLIEDQELGKYLGSTIQLSPHMTDLIQEKLLDVGKDVDVTIVEIGGTVGDAESYAFFEAARQFKQKHGESVIVTMVAPILWVKTVAEFKTKPLQNAVRELQRCSLQPDVLFCRSECATPDHVIDKVSSMTGIKSVFLAPDVSSIYQVALEFYDRHVDDLYVDMLRLGRSVCRVRKYREVVEKSIADLEAVEIAVVGKYDNHDAYISLKEALVHAGAANDVKVNVRWIRATDLEKYKDLRGLHKYFENINGVIVPGGFDGRGVEGKIKAVEYVRERKIPFLGICLGLQCAAIEFARNVCGMETANSTEFDKATPHPVVDYVEGQKDLAKKSATMRLGSYPCVLEKDSLAFEMYGTKQTTERHRHRYEINPKYVEEFAKAGFRVSGHNPDSGLVEMMELDRTLHPYFIGAQAHVEFKSRLTSAAPLFLGLISAAKKAK